MGEIIIVGLGPGAFSLITLETWDRLQSASHLLLRTAKHPTVAGLQQRGIEFTSFDAMYEQQATFEDVYDAIANECLQRAVQGEKVVYAVPGSPLVAERTVTLIRERARQQGIAVTVVPAMSFLEVLYCRLGFDPIHGMTVLDAQDISLVPPGLATALVITQVYNQRVASDTKLALMERYPDDYGITVAHNLGLPDEDVREVPLYELDRVPYIDHLTSVYIPPRSEQAERFSLQPLVDVMSRLRAPGGCVWDIEQNHSSLRRYIVEEVYEVLEAIELENGGQLCEELGDLLLQIVFHARIAEESGEFTMQDVVDTVTEKMVRRHPHVFGDITVQDAAEVIVNWDKIKKREKSERTSVLDGVPHGLPSLMRAYKLQAKAAKVGFDWERLDEVWAKVQEEMAELEEARITGDSRAIEGELGDVLFAIVNLARFIGIEPETALNSTNNKFIRRFSYIENCINRQGLIWEKVSLSELDALWNEAKTKEIGINE